MNNLFEKHVGDRVYERQVWVRAVMNQSVIRLGVQRVYVEISSDVSTRVWNCINNTPSVFTYIFRHYNTKENNLKTSVILEGTSQRYSAPHSSLEDQIAYYARVSNPSSQMAGLNTKRLIRYLILHKHWSPFEQVTINCQVDTTRDIAHQLVRHRSAYFQEFSQRYASTETVGDLRETRLQDYKNRQNSIKTDDETKIGLFNQIQSDVIDLCFGSYDRLLKNDIAKEQARAILPEGLTWTRLYMHGTVRSWIHYIELRSRPETQREHRDIAILAAKAIEPVFPMIQEFVYDEERERQKRFELYKELKQEFELPD
jgi:thymidylate synthase (FAD)